ncbi:hypothetical protein FRC10_005094 [Ceratobasidium sp. 414]|nr:hypothetical protein FRC10_005094 [Ceratobasidium sp. 414]
MLLARIFLSARHDLPVVASAAVIALASAVTAMYSPPGEDPSNNVDSRESQARDSLAHHHSSIEQALEGHPEDRSGMNTLFVFGFLGLLPKIDFDGLSNEIVEVSTGFQEIIGDLYPPGSENNSPMPIYNLPDTYTFSRHVSLTTCRYFLQHVEHPDSLSERPGEEQAFLLFLFPQLNLNTPNTGLYIAALIALCRSNSDGIRGACKQIIDAQPFPANPLQLAKPFDGANLLDVFYRNLSYDPPTPCSSRSLFALEHFRLLVVGVMLSASNSLGAGRAGRAALQPLWDRFNNPAQDAPHNPALSYRDLMSHVEGKPADMQSDLTSTLRLVGDFLNTTPGPSNGQDWHKELQGLKDKCGRDAEVIQEIQADVFPTETGEPSTPGIGVSNNGQTLASAAVLE